MRCYFRPEVECPVPVEKLTGEFCHACAAWENARATVMMAEASKRMTEASVFNPQTAEKKPDERRDVV